MVCWCVRKRDGEMEQRKPLGIVVAPQTTQSAAAGYLGYAAATNKNTAAMQIS